jgi:sulfite reductase (NADPH) flavoprotein alpha-component
MLTGPKLKIIEDLVATASREELVWLSGYLGGVLANEQPEKPAAGALQPTESFQPAATGARKMTIVYGTETGNAKKLATDLAAKAKKKNLQVKLASLDQYRLTDITREENLFVVISTQGDGEPPVAAQKFYEHIHRNGFRLDQLQYSVLALGDTSYPLFCKTGEDVDAQLQKLGGKRLIPVRKCDLDYENDAENWFQQVLAAIENTAKSNPVITVSPATVPVLKSNKKLYKAEILSNINLHDKSSPKETYHLELGVEEPVDYLPGDSIGIVPRNSVQVVEAIIRLAGIDGNKSILHKNEEYPTRELLQKKLNISHLHERVVKKYASIVQQDIPETKMHLLDLLRIYPMKDVAQFEDLLQELPVQSPRIYTIASSPAAHGDEIHLTVEKDEFMVNGKKNTGLCSDYLGSLQAGAVFEFFVQKNKRFRLPEAGKDILMIGPGTGIAAFRSFLGERDAVGASGKNWLFFGEDHFVSDFLYQTEIQNWVDTGVLTKVSLAFSKDGPANIGVHHKLLEHGKEVFEWIQSGAHLYVCGQKAPMSIDVENALLSIIERYSGLTAQDTLAYFEKLKTEGRYSKDVY